MKKYLIPIWECTDCQYKQDFEPTRENYEKFFKKRFRDFSALGIEDNDCIACSSGRNDSRQKRKKNKKMVMQHDDAKKSFVHVMDESDINDLVVEEDVFDSSQKKFIPIKRKLNNAEKSELITKIQNDHDHFSTVGKLWVDPMDNIKI